MKEQSDLKPGEIRQRILLLTQQRDQLIQEGRQLSQRFRKMYQAAKPAIRFSPYADASLVAFRWRTRGRGSRPLDLLSDEGLAVLDQQPLVVQKSWLDFERERQRLNLAFGLLEYERKKLDDWLRQHEKLQKVMKQCLGNFNQVKQQSEGGGYG